MTILFFAIVIAMISYAIAIPLFPFMVDALGGSGIHLGILMAIFGVMQLVFSPMWGMFSDRVGRKIVLMIGMLGLTGTMFAFSFVQALWHMYIAQVCLGFVSSAVFPASTAYAADITSKDERSAAMGKLGGAAGLGIIIGPSFGGLLADPTFTRPFLVASACAFITLLFIMKYLPDLGKGEKTALSTQNIALSEEKLIKPQKNRGEIPKLMVSSLKSPIGFGLFILFVIYFGKTGFSSVYGLFVLDRFGYGPTEVGILIMLMGIVYIIVQGFLIAPLTQRLGEKKLIKISLLGFSFGFLLLTWANTLITIAISICVFSVFNGTLKPAALGLVSAKTDLEQGAAMGLGDSFMSLGRIVGPLWAGVLYDLYIFLPYLSFAILILIVLGVSLRS